MARFWLSQAGRSCRKNFPKIKPNPAGVLTLKGNELMKKTLMTLLVYAALISACDMWSVNPQPLPAWTPIPSSTPGIVSPTPIILIPTIIATSTSTFTTGDFTPTPASVNTETPSPTATTALITPSETATLAPVQSVTLDILGCNTGIDITHGMGEVTNAYVTVKNNGTVDLPNTCALMRAIDEDREHPDKKKCVDNLPVQNQVTLKLTVDSAYKVNTVIQVDASSGDLLLLRVDQPSCTDIGLFGGEPADIGVVKPIQP